MVLVLSTFCVCLAADTNYMCKNLQMLTMLLITTCNWLNGVFFKQTYIKRLKNILLSWWSKVINLAGYVCSLIHFCYSWRVVIIIDEFIASKMICSAILNRDIYIGNLTSVSRKLREYFFLQFLYQNCRELIQC